jgi:hypothetical protein
VEPELVFINKVYSIGGNGGNVHFSRKGITVGHLKAGRHLYKKVLYAILLEGLE